MHSNLKVGVGLPSTLPLHYTINVLVLFINKLHVLNDCLLLRIYYGYLYYFCRLVFNEVFSV